MVEQDKDPYIGEIYRDMDVRTFERRIKILGFVGGGDGEKIWPRVIRTFGWEPKPKYRYEVVANAGNPGSVGRKGRISARTLDRDYMKVSH